MSCCPWRAVGRAEANGDLGSSGSTGDLSGHLTSTGTSAGLARSDDRLLHLDSPFSSLPPAGREAVLHALFRSVRERENPSRLLIVQALAPLTRLPRLHRACPSAALDKSVLAV